MASIVVLLQYSLVVVVVLSLNPTTIDAVPPASPIRCNGTGCVLSNAYGAWGDRKECLVRSVIYPTTEEELRSAVAMASQKRLKAKVVSGFSHTIPKLACPPTENSILISTEKYNRGIKVNPVDRTVMVDSGVGLRELIDAVEAAGLSLVAAPYWEGVSIGGLVSTGSHGSSWWGRGGAVHDHVVGLSMVVPAGEAEGYAKIIRLQPGDPLFNAALVSLGLLGVISKVTISLEEQFKRSITYSFQDDAHFEEEYVGHAQNHEFGDITWYPSQHKAVYRYDDRVPLNSPGDGMNDFLGFQSNPILLSTAVRASEKALEKSRNIRGKCSMASVEIWYKELIGNGLKNSVIFTGYPVLGRQGKMQTSGSCLHSPPSSRLSMCAWDPRIKGLFFYETTAIFPVSVFKNFILDVKKLRDLQPENFCGTDIYNGFLIRFIKSSEAYLGQSEDSVVLDFNYYRSDDPSTPRLNQDVWEEVEQMAFFKYGAKPHWGKNRKVAFLGVQQKYANLNKFIMASKQLDPLGMFSSPSSDEVFFGKETAKDDKCALEGLCICSDDRHCSPSQGYLCKPGLVFKEARVCRFTKDGSFLI
ncbi:L-gulonolactone oxidase 3 [Typha latifolia]|uniref:L-gulonolactone oxidase 3 n=1 Tax=Typha latifolia TaxID=4733 RepID=UPI003C2CD637